LLILIAPKWFFISFISSCCFIHRPLQVLALNKFILHHHLLTCEKKSFLAGRLACVYFSLLLLLFLLFFRHKWKKKNSDITRAVFWNEEIHHSKKFRQESTKTLIDGNEPVQRIKKKQYICDTCNRRKRIFSQIYMIHIQ